MKAAANLPMESIEELVDFVSLREQLDAIFKTQLDSNITPDALKLLKQSVININDGLKAIYQQDHDADTVVYGRSYLTDCLLKIIFNRMFKGCNQPISLIAVGGYGRGELHPKSDIDLMILLGEEENDDTRDVLEKFLMLLWDIHLEIGHSVRTVDECVEEAEKDITVATNIMEARLLAGDDTLFTRMKTATGPESIWNSKAFFQAKLEEQIQRNGKYNDTAYNLEPNIKESHGGLRDIQMIGWVAKRHFGADSLYDLVNEGFLLQDELDTMLQGQNLLWQIRCSLHYLAGRREDRLLFDYQRDLATEFGFENDEDKPGNEAIEQFMQQYYRTVIELERLNEMLLQHFREAIIYADSDNETEVINENFQVRNGYLETREETVFEKNPCAILQLFLVLQDYPDIQGVRAETIREVRHYRHLIDDSVRQSPYAHKIFMSIMTRSRGVTHELRRMNRYGILAAYIPAFESIVGRMQYDLFHAYTVDQHTLFVIRNMRRLSVPEFCHEFPLASGIFQHLKNPGLLYLSGLFHDIAKGREGDHSTLGAIDAKAFCDLHDLTEDESELVSWLVDNHLIMSMTAQRKDISDPKVISKFADQMGSIERLDYLYLLTISDIRGTNPKQWNNWKDKLLSELYNKTASFLNNGLGQSGINQYSGRETNILETQTDSLRQLQELGIDSHQANELWKTLNDDYFLSHTAGEIVWHSSLINSEREEHGLVRPLVKTRVDESGNSVELMVFMKDREQIFFDVVNVLSNSEVDIVNAQITNTSDGYALETFRLIPVNPNTAELDIVADIIDQRLQEKLVEDATPSDDSPGIGVGSHHKYKHFSSPTEVSYKKTSDEYSSQIIIETLDRTGVLANIAKAMTNNGIKILNARIGTAGERAIDHFTICTYDDTALTQEQKKTLEEELKELL